MHSWVDNILPLARVHVNAISRGTCYALSPISSCRESLPVLSSDCRQAPCTASGRERCRKFSLQIRLERQKIENPLYNSTVSPTRIQASTISIVTSLQLIPVQNAKDHSHSTQPAAFLSPLFYTAAATMSVVGIDLGAQSTKIGVARNKGIDIVSF